MPRPASQGSVRTLWRVGLLLLYVTGIVFGIIGVCGVKQGSARSTLMHSVVGLLLNGTLLWIVAAPPDFSHGLESRGTYPNIGMGIGALIQGALVNYAADNVDYAYPKAEYIRDYASLRALVNQYGVASLPESEAKTGFRFVSYEMQDTDNDGVPDSYLLILVAIDADGKPVRQLRVSPGDYQWLVLPE